MVSSTFFSSGMTVTFDSFSVNPGVPDSRLFDVTRDSICHSMHCDHACNGNTGDCLCRQGYRLINGRECSGKKVEKKCKKLINQTKVSDICAVHV